MTDTPKTRDELFDIIKELEAENARLSKLADVSIEANADAHGLRSALERAEADCAGLKMALRAVASCAPPEADYTSDMMIYQSLALECKNIARQALSDYPGDKLLAVVKAARTLVREDESEYNVETLISALEAMDKGE